jgi:hypothetical protein
MRRIAVPALGLVIGLTLGLTAVSETAGARPRGLRGALFGIVSQPLKILRPPRSMSRRATHRRPAVARTRQPSPAAEARSAAPNAATQTAGTASAVAPAAAAGTAVAATGAAAATATSAPTAATAGGAPSMEPAAAPGAAAAQRSAAWSPPADEPQPRSRDASRAGRSAPQAAAGPLGLVGPPAWPTAFEDVVGFALWPDRYAERLRVHGIGDVMSALFAPGAGAALSGAQVPARSRTDGTDGTGRSDAGAAASPCASGAPASEDWPTKPIEQAMALNEPQRAALDQLRTALGEAVAAIRATCRDNAPRGSAERLHAMQSAMWAVRDAAMLVRAPLINFYRALTDEQKTHFTVQVSQPDPRLAQMQQRATERRGGAPQIPREVARMCGMSAANEWPLRQIEQAIRPSKEQKASLEALQKKSTEMGQLLIASCLQPVAATPEARLDSALDRLTAMLFAITNVALAFNDFHGQLSDAQKARLGAFGL